MTNNATLNDTTGSNDMTSLPAFPKITRDEILDFAHMPVTGDYAADCEIGRKTADELISWMAKTGFTPALGTVVQEMMTLGRWGAVHIGFFQKLADRSLPAPA